MKRESIGRTRVLVALAIGVATWSAAPLHADRPHRNAPPAPVRPARQEPQKERAQEPQKDREKPSPEELRAQAEKDRIEKARIEQRRKEAQGERGGPAGTPGARAPAQGIEQRREIARQAAKFESSYRNHVARVNRLIGIYKAKGDEAKVAQLERLRAKLDLRKEHAMEGFRRDLGEDGFQKVQGQIDAKGRRAPEDKAKPPGGDR